MNEGLKEMQRKQEQRDGEVKKEIVSTRKLWGK